jgi:hypothetical protein
MRFKICSLENYDKFCSNVNKSQIVLKNYNSKTCKVLSGTNTTLKKTEFFNDVEKNLTGLEITFPPGEICNTTTNETYQIKMKFICDNSLPTGVFSPIFSSFDGSKCQNNIQLRSANGNLFK